MKKILSLVLCIIMTVTLTVGCAKRDDNDKGAIIPVYLAPEIPNFDPAYSMHNEASMKILGLIYEGLTRMTANGKVENALMKSRQIFENTAKNEYRLQIELNDTSWSDGRAVSADDFVFAWKRLLEPEFSSEAASMLYDIKNARAVKNGDMTIDDLGLYAADITVLQIEFETKVDYDLFLENCANPALFPLREDKVVKLKNWASNPSTMVTNGPFFIKSYKAGEMMEIERNVYYYRNVAKEDSLFKSVTPYRFVINFSKDAAAQFAAYNDGSVFFINDIPLSERANAKGAVTLALPSTHTYVLNTAKAPFNKAEVRQALSLAIDRNTIVSKIIYAKAAGGIINSVVKENAKGGSFRSAAGDIISPSADVAKAKNLLSSAGVNGGNITLSIRPSEIDRVVAEYVSGVWSQLGFSVTVKELGTEKYEEIEYDQWRDLFEDAYRSGDFDVIAIDMNMYSSDAFPTLAMFAKPFSGGALDLANKNFDYVPHVSGYSDGAYDALIDEIFANKDRAGRGVKLREAEKMLLDAMPVIPLFEYQDAYMMSGELSNVRNTYYGYKIFNKTKLKNYLDYITTAAAASADDEETAE